MNTDTVTRIKRDQIKTRPGFNTRKQFGDMDALKASLLNHGWQDAVAVQKQDDGSYLLGAQGHRRLKALDELIADGYQKNALGEAFTIPVKMEAENIDDETRLLQIITLNTGEPLKFIEQARVYGAILGDERYQDAKEKRAKIKELSAATGVSQTAINNSLTLLTAPNSLLRLVDSGKVTATLVLELFIEANACTGDWEKVEAAVLAAIADAESKGKGKASRKNLKKEDKEDEGDDEEAEAKEAVKARNKELLGIERRAVKAAALARELDEEAKTGDDVQKGIASTVFMLVAHILGEAHQEALVEGQVNLSDVRANFAQALRAHKATVKETVNEVKEEAKAKVEEVKEKAAAKVEKLKAKK